MTFEYDRHFDYLDKAIALIELNRPKEALPLLTKFLAYEPYHYRGVCYLSNCFGQLKEGEKSLHYANQAIQLNPNESWAYRLRSYALSSLGRFEEGLAAAQQAIRIDPESTYNLTCLIDAYIDCNQLKEAWQTGEKLRSLDPYDADVFVNLGYILIGKKRYDQAKWYLEEALKIEPNNSFALNNLAVVYERRDDKKTALKYYQLSLQANPHDNIALENIEKLSRKNVSLADLPPPLRNHLVTQKAKAERQANLASQPEEKTNGCLYLIVAIILIKVLIVLLRQC